MTTNLDLAERLGVVLKRRAPATLFDEAAQRASVALIVTAGPGAAILLVKRRERSGDPWSGHAAFPGGYRSAADASPIATAARETEEETGLALREAGTSLGMLDDVYPRSVHLPRVIVTPCVFSVPSELPVNPSNETERAVWVPATTLLDPARQPFVLSLPSGRREFGSIHVAGLVVWGLTERVISQLADILSAAGGAP